MILFNLYSFYLFYIVNLHNNKTSLTEDEEKDQNIKNYDSASNIKIEKCDEEYSKIDEIRRNIYDDLIDLQFYLKSEFKQLELNHTNLANDKKFSSLKLNTKLRLK